ncbi:MAG: nuclear transport factor 2 family protein [Pseudomonadota bacterium]
MSEAVEIGLAFIRAYNDCFYRRDLAGLRALYSDQAFTVFWDNHRECDSTTLDDHLGKVGAFFAHGKATESGAVEPLVIETPRAHLTDASLLITAVLRYHSAPRPGVRSTFCLVDEGGTWKAIHIHHSFDPNEAD